MFFPSFLFCHSQDMIIEMLTEAKGVLRAMIFLLASTFDVVYLKGPNIVKSAFRTDYPA